MSPSPRLAPAAVLGGVIALAAALTALSPVAAVLFAKAWASFSALAMISEQADAATARRRGRAVRPLAARAVRAMMLGACLAAGGIALFGAAATFG